MPSVHKHARRFFSLCGVGMIGLMGLMLQEPPAALLDREPQLHALPDWVLRLLLAAGPAVLVICMAAAGVACAHRVGFRSALAGDAGARPDLRLGLLAGMMVGLALVLLDKLFPEPLLAASAPHLSSAVASQSWTMLVTGVLYGGIAEEIIMRWGVMSLAACGLAWTFGRLSRGETQVTDVIAWSSIGVSALIFAVSHYPALALLVEPSPVVVAQSMLMNVLAGAVYGWLFWRRSLECAMTSHACTHLVFGAARWLG
ncbi:MAG: CPBP family intramembrane metalloprotease [Hylemonella sp.]|uniref:CPBP family intramembrane glutamic endopeptidase n=1 Tax=Hylemonella sp. TaxID=2066020 RepID=UPI0022C9CC60|nr:CPBP family intramembrane glutamic endopeptidase [Hylemonella sp.]MCZ8251190.1 CPBP family intramembrane metalloprotease [Hylemonella sp.]